MGRDSYDDDDDSEGGIHEIRESSTPKMNRFVHDISDWLLLGTVIFVLIYGLIYLFYEIALGMAHVRWVFNAFLLLCLVDMVMYFLLRFAVVGGETNMCLVYLCALSFTATMIILIGAPALVLVQYQLTLDHPRYGQTVAVAADESAGTGSDNVDCAVNPTDAKFKCGVVQSIRTSIWCMYLLLLPRPLLLYGIFSIVKKGR